MIVVFGSINLDLIFAVPHLPTQGETVVGPAMRIEPGGKGANQAVAAARDGAHVIFAGAVGQDALAEDALSGLRAANIDTTRITRAPQSPTTATGCAAICVDPHGRNLISVASGANNAVTHTQVEDAILTPAATLLLQREIPQAEIESIIRRARARNARILLNLAPAGPIALDALQALDVLILNEHEAAWLAAHRHCPPTAAALHQSLGITTVVTQGAAGLTAASAEAEIHLPAHPVTVLDTTGAGDCFTGVLAAALDRGLPLPDALARANKAAALSCTRPGTQGSMPKIEEISLLF